MVALKTPPTEALAVSEQNDLARYEKVISSGLATFKQVGSALMQIRDKKLYRETHDDFETYCKDKWGFTRQRGNQLIGAAQLAGKLETSGFLPMTTEREARQVAKDLLGGNPTAAKLAKDMESWSAEEMAEARQKAEAKHFERKSKAAAFRGKGPAAPHAKTLGITKDILAKLPAWRKSLDPDIAEGVEKRIDRIEEECKAIIEACAA